MTTVQDWQIWKPEINAYIDAELEVSPKSYYEQIFKVEPTNRLQLPELDKGGYNPMEQVSESGDALEDDAIEGYKFVYQTTHYRKFTRFSSDVMQTDQKSQVKELAKNFAQLPQTSRDLRIFSSVRRAFDAGLTYGDAKPLISLSHPRKDGGAAQGNTYSDGKQLALSYDNALKLQDVLLATVSQSGNLLNVGGMGRNKVLFGSQYQREKLFQIAGVQTSGEKPGTTDRETNYFTKGDRFDVLILPWISYEAAVRAGETTLAKTDSGNYWDKMWGVLDIDLVKKFSKVYTREGYWKFDEELDKNNESMKKFVYDAYGFGFTSWMGWAISKGDNSTYSG